MAPLIIRFLLPVELPFILATVIPIPDASIPDSDIVTAAPTFIVFLNVDTPATSNIPVLTLSVAAIPVKFAPDIAGNAPVKFAAGKLVKFAPLIAGSVPVIFAAGKLVNPDPFAVVTPVKNTSPSGLIVAAVPTFIFPELSILNKLF